jgi:hypothetical protein
MVSAGGSEALSSGNAAAADAAGASCGAGKDSVDNGGALPQAASIPTMPSAAAFTNCFMLLILLEALLALALLVSIVWWTMFSGRPGGEPPAPEAPQPPRGATSDAGGRDEPATRKD